MQETPWRGEGASVRRSARGSQSLGVLTMARTRTARAAASECSMMCATTKRTAVAAARSAA
eukprot:5924241-Pleurochrysis_carterae.AAC.1